MKRLNRQDALLRLANYKLQYLGSSEVCEVLGLRKQVLWNRQRRGAICEPAFILRATPVWARKDLEAWLVLK
jgi:hypothetical protein